MRRRMIIAAAVLSAAWAAAAADDAKNLAAVHKKASGALAVVRCTYTGDAGARTVAGLGICVQRDASQRGTFLSLMVDPGVPEDSFTNFELIVPGAAGKTLKAELLGTDPETGATFIRATEKHPWSVVQFSAAANVKIGDQIASVGMLPADLGYPTCLGTARVSAVLRVPGKLVYVSGGKLTGVGSPVFSSDGRAIGIVGRQQFFLGFETLTQRGVATLRLKGTQETSFFTPVEEFADAITRIPAPGKKRRLRWIGVLRYGGVSRHLAELAKLEQPGVMIEQIVPAGPAAKAGLMERDVIVGVDGQKLERLATADLTAKNFARKIRTMPAGKKITLSVFREKKPLKVTVQLAAMPLMPNEAKRHFSIPLGLALREKVPLDQQLGKGPVAKEKGMIVIRLQPGGPAHKVGVQTGDLITSINKQQVTTAAGAKNAIEQAIGAKPKAVITLQIRRGDRVLEIAVEPRP